MSSPNYGFWSSPSQSFTAGVRIRYLTVNANQVCLILCSSFHTKWTPRSIGPTDPARLARTAVNHLRREISQEPPDLECIAWDIHILSALALIANICLPLIGAGALAVCVDTLSFIVSRSWEAESRTLAARCVTNAAVHLEEALEDLDGTTLVLEALRMDLLPTLLKCEPLLPFADNKKARQEPGKLLCAIISNYTIYRSVLRDVIPLIEEAEESGLVRKLKKGGSMEADWLKLKEKVDERRELLKQASPLAIQNCHNERVRDQRKPGAPC